jgi:hypothetical protein
LAKRIDGIQAGLRTARAEISALHTRISLLEHRLNTMDVRLGELPISIEELKTHIDLRLDDLEIADVPFQNGKERRRNRVGRSP